MKNNKQKLNLFAFTLLLFAANMSAQVVQKFGENSLTIDTNAVLELDSATKGLLLPRVALTTLTATLPMTGGPITAGMIVYNTTPTGDFTPGFYYHNGAKWVRVADSGAIAASSITGTLPVASGGTGTTTLSGIVKGNGVGAMTVAGESDFPLLNQNTSGTAATATNTAITNNSALTSVVYPTFVTAVGGNLPQTISSSTLTFVPSSGILTATKFVGDGSGLSGVVSTTNANLSGAITSAGNVTSLGTFTSLNIANAVTDETGTGSLVLADSPTFTGIPNLPTGTVGVTQTAGNSTTALATTAFVAATVNLPAITAKIANYSALTTDSTILFDTSGAGAPGYTLTLPAAAAGNTGKIYIIRKDVSNVKLNFLPGIYLTTGSTAFTSINYAKTIRIQSDGSKWLIID
jgi:hypothetical protein